MHDEIQDHEERWDALETVLDQIALVAEYEQRWDALEEELKRVYVREHCVVPATLRNHRRMEILLGKRIPAHNFTAN